MQKTALTLVGGILVSGLVLPAGAEEIVRLKDPDQYELQAVGLSLDRRGEVEIEAVGVRPPWNDDLAVYAWLLDAKTRQPVWVMKRRDTERVRNSRLLRRSKASIPLNAGRYELYFYSGTGDGNIVINFGGIGNFWRSRDRDDWDDEIDDCYVSLSSTDLAASDVGRFEVTGGLEDALVHFNKIGDSESVSQGFEITRPTNLKVYCLFEEPKGSDSPADYGWIVNAETLDTVWRCSKRDTRPAGGGDKNRVFDKEIPFEAGRYILRYGTDDSHSYEEFNVNPPYDPLNWGIALLPGEGFRPSDFRAFDATQHGDEIVSFTKVGDSEFHEQAFRVGHEGAVRIFALGEYDRSDREFADYAWIKRAGTGEPVWEMTRQNTMPAGGDEKNRVFDGEVRLDAGEYELFYVTDDSHSFDDWNAGAPIDPDAWGVTVYATSTLGKSDVKLISDEAARKDGDVVAQIIRVGDSSRRRERFTLDHDADVHVYALGEGVDGDMYDYAYIIDSDTDRTAWEMEYRDTRHAGGARKNRVFDDTVHLRAGKYELVYESDGSHSFDGWNARRPRDPMNWGVTVTKAR